MAGTVLASWSKRLGYQSFIEELCAFPAAPTTIRSRPLRAPGGRKALIKTTGRQQHSVPGFVAGVVRKKLKLTLQSDKSDGERIYRIVDAKQRKPKASVSTTDQRTA